MQLNTTVALKLHAYGLTQLHDPNWTGMELFDRLKQHTRGRVEPVDLLRKTLKQGLLYHIGLWILEDYFFSDTHRMSLGGEYLFWYLEDLLELLSSGGVPKQAKNVPEAESFIVQTNALYSQEESKYWDEVDSEQTYSLIQNLIDSHETSIRKLLPEYATNYAERVFHDRQLCEHIGKTLIVISFDGTDGEEEPKQWIERESWPSWAVKAVVARDRGLCAECGVSISAELRAEGQIDHIVPLAKGGTNDLVNLQLLCGDCNNAKSAALKDVKSSVPQYLLQLKYRKRK